MEHSETLREKLVDINAESIEGSYREGILKMLDKKLGLVARTLYGIVSIVCLMAAWYFASWVFKKYFGNEFAAFIMRIICSAGLIFSVILMFFSGWSAMTGKVKGRFCGELIFGSTIVVLCYFLVSLSYMVFIFPVMMELEGSSETPFFYMSAVGIQLMLLGFFAMVAFGLVFTFRLLSDLKFTNQRKLLEIEYKLCDLAVKSKM